jgi:hypothetical protein
MFVFHHCLKAFYLVMATARVKDGNGSDKEGEDSNMKDHQHVHDSMAEETPFQQNSDGADIDIGKCVLCFTGFTSDQTLFESYSDN